MGGTHSTPQLQRYDIKYHEFFQENDFTHLLPSVSWTIKRVISTSYHHKGGSHDSSYFQEKNLYDELNAMEYLLFRIGYFITILPIQGDQRTTLIIITLARIHLGIFQLIVTVSVNVEYNQQRHKSYPPSTLQLSLVLASNQCKYAG